MAYRNKRRKIKHPKRTSMYKKKRSSVYKIFMTILTILILGALVFLGFSIGKPIIDYFNGSGNSSEDSDESNSSNSSHDSASDSSSEESSDESSASDVEADNTKALKLSAGALTNLSLLQGELASAKSNGYNTVVLELVADGGLIYYATEQNMAISYEAVQSELTVSEIANAVSDAQMKSIVRFSVLTDHIVARMDKSVGYTFSSDISTWVDNSPELGGKAWISPFKEKSQEYLVFLASEINSAGFDEIVMADIEFPFMRNSDLNYLGESVKSATRYTALLEIVNILKNNTGIGDKMILEVSAASVIQGTEEVFCNSKPEVSKLCLNINLSELTGKLITAGEDEIDFTSLSNTEKARLAYSEAVKQAVGYDIYIAINESDFDSGEINYLVQNFNSSGVKSVLVY